MGNVSDEQFLALFRQMQEPVESLEGRLAQLEKQPSRAEVAGAVEVVATLPGAGQQGRILYQSGDPAGLYVDGGTQWAGPVASPEPGGLLAYAEYVNDSTFDWTGTFTPANPTEWYLAVVAPPGPFEVVLSAFLVHSGSSTVHGYIDIGYDDGAGGVVRNGHVDYGLTRLSGHGASLYTLVSHWNLTPGQPYRFYLLGRNASGYTCRVVSNQLLRFWAKGL